MIKIQTIINTPVPSNTYVLEENGECLVIDPGTKDCQQITDMVESKHLTPKYILLTHGDFDHTWGVNTLKERYPGLQIVAGKETARQIAIPQNYFSALYFNNTEYYSIPKVDIIIDDNGNQMNWNDNRITFIQVPGHTSCSNIILINDWVFSGDTILKGTKPIIQKKHGGSLPDFKKSVTYILDTFSDSQKIYPGHGDPFLLGQVKDFYKDYISRI